MTLEQSLEQSQQGMNRARQYPSTIYKPAINQIIPPSIGVFCGYCGCGTGGDGSFIASCRAIAFICPPSLELFRSRLRGFCALSTPSESDRCSSVIVGWCISGLSPFNAPISVCAVVCRRLRGFIGGTGGAPMPLFALAPGGSPKVGTLDVHETNVGSDILYLLIGLLCGPTCPGARCGMPSGGASKLEGGCACDW